jgi:NAD(P)-dependent dehydrogenase (short-subunit alcohol dehydrogenase family)
MQSLENKKVLVVGGSSGIGLAAAALALNAGAKVTIASRDRARLDGAVKKLGPGSDGRVLDTTDQSSVDAFFTADPTWDHVVASAGAGGRGFLPELAMERAFAAMDAKFWGYFRIARAVRLPPDGSLTFVSGQLSQIPSRGATLVSAINAAIEGMTRGLAVDLAPTRVNTICPGVIDTPLWDQLPPDARKALYDKQAETLLTRRIGQPEDVAEAILAAMTNRFMTGTVMMVEGGAGLLSGY